MTHSNRQEPPPAQPYAPEPPTPSQPALSTGLPALQAFAAVSGLLLVSLFISGRVYLAASLRPFHASVADLGLPIHEVMFASWTVFLPILVSLIGLIVALPQIQALVFLTAHLARIDRELPRIKSQAANLTEQLRQRIADGHGDEQAPDELVAGVKHVEGRLLSLECLTAQVDAQVDRIDTYEPFHFKPLPAIALPPYSQLVYLAPLLAVAAAAPIFFWLSGWPSGLFDSAALVLLMAINYAIFFSAREVLRAQSPFWKLAIALTLALVVLLPYPALTGLFHGLSNRYNSSAPGSAFTEVIIWSSQPIQPDWQQSDDSYHSPKLRLIGEHSGRLTLWNPQDPGTLIEVPTTSIALLQRQ